MYQEVLKKLGFKITKPREKVISFLAKSKHPLSAQEIYQSLKNNIDQATVYRVLEVLEEVGVVFREQLNNQAVYYLADKQHHHIICRQCGSTQCLPCNHVFEKVKGFKEVKHQLVLTGVCNKCNN